MLSFVYVGTYWNNHHHLLHAVQKINGPILWANLHLRFWLSLFPFVTDWMGENHFSTWPVAVYGVVLLVVAVAYAILVSALLKLHGRNSPLAAALDKDMKGKLSILVYAAAIPLSFAGRWLAVGLYVPVHRVSSFRLLGGSRLEVSAMDTPYLRKRKTSTVSPAKPGDYPLDLRIST